MRFLFYLLFATLIFNTTFVLGEINNDALDSNKRDTKNILIISQTSLAHPLITTLCAKIKNINTNGYSFKIDFFETYKPAKIIELQRIHELNSNILKDKIKINKYDLIIAIYPSPIDIVKSADIPNEIPIIALCLENKFNELKEIHKHSVGVIFEYNLEDTINFALKFLPNIHEILIIHESIFNKESFSKNVEVLTEKFPNTKTTSIDISSFQASEIIEKIENMGDNSIVVFAPWTTINSNSPYIISSISPKKSKPIFLLNDIFLDNNFVAGGYLSSAENNAELVSKQIQRIIKNNSAQNLSSLFERKKLILTEYAINKWNISKNKIPPETIILPLDENKTKTFFYKLFIGVIAILLLVLLLFYLYVKKVFDAEKADRISKENLMLKSQSLQIRSLILSNLSEAIVVIDAEFKITLINKKAQQLLNASENELIGKDVRNIIIFKNTNKENITSPFVTVFEFGKQIEIQHLFIGNNDKIFAQKCIPIKNGSSVNGAIMIISDITQESKHLEKLYINETLIKSLNTNALMEFFIFEEKNKTFDFIDENMWTKWPRDKNNNPLPVTEWIHPEDLREVTRQLFEYTMKMREKLEIIFRANIENRQSYILFYINRTFNPFTKKQLNIGFFRDITEREKMRLKLIDSTKMMESILENIPSQVILKDTNKDYDVIFDSKKSSSTNIAKLIESSIINDQDLPTNLRNDYNEIPSFGESTKKYLKFTLKSGKKLTIELQKIFFKKYNDKHILLEYYTDITDIENQREEMEKTNVVFTTILENLPALISIKDTEDNNKYILWNAGVEKITGISSEQAIGHTDIELFGSDAAVRFKKTCSDSQQKGKISIQETWITPTGIHYDLITQIVTISVLDKKYNVIMSHDITEQKRLERENNKLLESLNRSLSDITNSNKTRNFFLSSVNRDILTTMARLVGSCELLSTNILPQQKETKIYVDAISTAGKELINLVNNLIEISTPTFDSIDICPTPSDIRNLAEEIQDEFKAKAKDKNIDLQLKIQSNIPTLEIDSLRLRQILLVLVSNAIQLTQNGSIFIDIKTQIVSNDSQNLFIKISDTGIGMSEETINWILLDSKNQNFDEIISNKIDMRFIVKLIHKLNAKIDIKNNNPKGTIITLTFNDIKTFKDTDIIKICKREDPSEKNILIVYDTEMNLNILAAMVEMCGFKTIKASSSKDALKILNEKKIHLIITDIRMPDMNGSELAAEIKKIDKFKNIPIFAYTADREIEKNFPTDDFDCVLIKPITISKLKSVLSYSNN